MAAHPALDDPCSDEFQRQVGYLRQVVRRHLVSERHQNDHHRLANVGRSSSVGCFCSGCRTTGDCKNGCGSSTNRLREKHLHRVRRRDHRRHAPLGQSSRWP